MKQRVITGVGFFLITVAGVLLQGWYLRLLVFAMMCIGMHEMYHALQQTGADPKRWPGYVYCVLTLVLELMEACGWLKLSAPVLSLVIGVLIAMTAVVFQGQVNYTRMNASVFPMLYPGLFFSLLMATQDLPGNRLEHVVMLALVFYTASVNDVFALLVGVRFGRHKLAPQISPKKSIEGSIGGLVAGSIFSVIMFRAALIVTHLCPEVIGGVEVLPRTWVFALVGPLLSAFSQIGDLVASLVKRHCGIKDFGRLLPGHGGIMDRMDGILFSTAACWVVFALLLL